MAAPELHDIACVAHLHSTYSDGTGTVPQIAEAARRNGLDVVLLTDHDTLEAKEKGEERRYDGVLVLVGEEVSPVGRNHLLAFGPQEAIDHEQMTPAEVCSAVHEAGGICFAAHPFSQGSPRFRRAVGMPFEDLEAEHLTGIELWSFVTDTAESVETLGDVARFLVRPERFVGHPPERNMREWDRLCQRRPVVAIGGLDAHQFGIRVAGHVPLRLMSYRRSFGFLRTHALCERPLGESVDADRAEVYGALGAGRCYLAMDSLSPARGFNFWAAGPEGTLPMGATAAASGAWALHVESPRPARLRLLRDGAEMTSTHGRSLEHSAGDPGVYRVEASLEAHGSERTWVLTNPIYLR
jgi:PHP domain-containing protein